MTSRKDFLKTLSPGHKTLRKRYIDVNKYIAKEGNKEENANTAAREEMTALRESDFLSKSSYQKVIGLKYIY